METKGGMSGNEHKKQKVLETNDMYNGYHLCAEFYDLDWISRDSSYGVAAKRIVF